MAIEDFKKTWQKVVIKAWQDPSFKKKLMASPNEVLEAEGFNVPSDVSVQVVENTDEKIYLTIPAKPEGSLSEKELETAAGGDIERIWWHTF